MMARAIHSMRVANRMRDFDVMQLATKPEMGKKRIVERCANATHMQQKSVRI